MCGSVAGFPALWCYLVGSTIYVGPLPSCASSWDVFVSAGVGAQCSRVTFPPGCSAGVARGLVWAHALRTVAGAGPLTATWNH